MSESIPSKPTGKASLLASVVVVVVCLSLGAAFIAWYVRGAPEQRSIKLGPDDLAAMQQAGQRLIYSSSGGIPAVRGGAAALALRSTVARVAADPDGVFPAGNWQVIKAGPVQVRVQPPAAAGGAATLIFHQRSWGMLQEGANYTIARRIVREDALAKQLAITPDQLAKLTALVNQPAVHGDYLSALPIDPAELTAARKAWADYQAAAKGGAAPKAATSALVGVIREIGSRSMAKARQDYTQASGQIDSILEPRQVEAYRTNKTLTPLK